MSGPLRLALFVLSVLAVPSVLLPPGLSAERVRTVVPRATLNYLSVPVAEIKGFFRDENLENETIVIPGSTAIAALVSGDVDYSGAGGTGMRAALRGAPIKAIMFQTEKVTWYLIAAPEITKATDLRGKRVAVGTVGDTQDALITAYAERSGVAARDLVRVGMPSRTTMTTILGLKSGAIQAATVNGDEALIAEKEGLRTLTFIGDLFPYPFQGFMAADKKIADKPGDVKRWLRAMMRALIFIRERPEEAADIALKKLPMANNTSRAIVVEGIRRFTRALPDGVPGVPTPQGIKNMIEYDVKAPLKIKEDVAPEKFLFLKLASEVKEELEKSASATRAKEDALMRITAFATICLLMLLSPVSGQSIKTSVLIDLDPASAAQTVIVESVAADSKGMLYTADRVSGHVWRINPNNPQAVIVGRVPEREIDGKKVRADVSGIAFNAAGDLYLTAGGFKEVLRILGKELDPQKPGTAQTFATETENANGIAFDKAGRSYVSGGRSGKIYRTGPEGGKADVVIQIPPHVRTLPDGKTQQALTANGMVFDRSGTTLYIADTARGAIWKSAIADDGQAGPPQSVVQSALLEGADGPDFDRQGNLWVAANERNAVVVVTPEGRVYDAVKNDSKGPLEFPTCVVIVGNTVYVSNFDTPRRDNLAADGKTSIDGIGASIVKIDP